MSISSLGFGHQAGGQVIDSIIVMNYRAAVKAFYDGGGQLQLGVGASLAAGPFGRAADVSASASSTTHIAATYAYSASKGLYAGYSFEGSRISERPNTNRAYYGRSITAKEILTGYVAAPQDAAKLYQLLNNLGAGPRPGLPFAPQKTQNMPPHMASPMPYSQQQQQQQAHPPPPPPKDNNFEEPPPPYEQLDPSKPAPPVKIETLSISESAEESHRDEQQQQQRQEEPSINMNSKPTETTNESLNSLPSIDTNSKLTQQEEVVDKPNEYTQEGSSSTSNRFDEAYHITPTESLDPHGYPKDIKRPLDEQQQENAMTVVVAKYDYTADRPSDLSFKAGDTIIVTKRLEDRQTWWEGEIGDKRGFFPANYTEEITE